MTLSVIVPAYNDLTRVMLCLWSLQRAASAPTEYIVSDDCSPLLDMREYIPAYCAQVFRNEVNLGFAGNCNAGASHAHGDILLICNHDIYAVPEWSMGWDAALLSAFQDESVGVVGARLLFPNGSIQSAGGLYDAAGAPFHRCLGWSNPFHEEVNTPCDVQWVTGAALAIRRTLFAEIGGFDTSFKRGYFEDVALCEEAKKHGYKVRYEPACTLIHEVGSTGGVSGDVFLHNAMLFKQRYVDTRIVKPDVPFRAVNYW